MTKAAKPRRYVISIDDVTVSFLRECFDLDEFSGVLTWRVRPGEHFLNGEYARRMNRAHAFRVAGGPTSKGGHLKVFISGRAFLMHRIVYAMFHGLDLADVPAIIDHANGDGMDNRPCNLRAATPLQSSWNTGPKAGTRFGLKGVSASATEGKYVAEIQAFGKKVKLGTFDTREEAAAAYRGAAKILHGEYMRDLSAA